MNDDRTEIEREIDRLADKVQWPEPKANEVMIGETSPWKPEDDEVVQARMWMQSLAAEIRLRTENAWRLSPKHRKAVLAAADAVERAI